MIDGLTITQPNPDQPIYVCGPALEGSPGIGRDDLLAAPGKKVLIYCALGGDITEATQVMRLLHDVPDIEAVRVPNELLALARQGRLVTQPGTLVVEMPIPITLRDTYITMAFEEADKVCQSIPYGVPGKHEIRRRKDEYRLRQQYHGKHFKK
jgi:hypothetical protein